MCIRDSAYSSARGLPGGEAPGEVGVHVRPDRFSGAPPGEVTRGSRALEEVPRQPEESIPVFPRGR
eukprot:9991986-Alexandrium_andersonii.AAC.1